MAELDSHPKTDPMGGCLGLRESLEAEFLLLLPEEQLRARWEKQLADCPDERTRMQTLIRAFHDQKRSALCLSGGGIRSATFALGVVQGLAKAGALGRFDFLSTVSGGGFLGGWLQAWMRREGQARVLQALARHEPVWGDVREESSGPVRAMGPEPTPEPRPVWWLRCYSNYLSPRLGFLSSDTWTLVASVARNLVLSWMVLVPLLLAALALPHLFRASILSATYSWNEVRTWLGVGMAFNAVALAATLGFRPSADPAYDPGKPGATGRGPAVLLMACLVPLLVGVACLTVAWAGASRSFASGGRQPVYWHFVAGPALSVFLGWMGYALLWRRWRWVEGVAGVLAGALGGGVLLGLSRLKVLDPAWCQGVPSIALAIPMVLLTANLIGTCIIALGSRLGWQDEQDREWYARLGGWILLSAVLWATVTGLALAGPYLVASSMLGAAAFLATSGGAAALSLWGALSGRGRGREGEAGAAIRLASPAAGVVALLGVMTALAVLVDWILVRIQVPVPPAPKFLEWVINLQSMALVQQGPLLPAAVAAGGLCLGYLLSWVIPLNLFSLHSLYRNRLIRAYLGASHSRRHPHRFTGFDPEDDFPLSRLIREAPRGESDGPLSEEFLKRPHKLFPVVNMALNLSRSDNLAWQERKAESFAATPLHCGALFTGFRPSWGYGGKHGMTLGTATTLSGAAANPNMGYHDSATLAFLMTFFNVRLGAWKGNPGPAGASTWTLEEPGFFLPLLISEALRLTGRDHPFVNLSDGGHFENLGLYQMALRRCHLILVSDASADPRGTLEDLGIALRKIQTDLGIPVTFADGPRTWSRDQEEDRGAGQRFAVGTLHYEEVDGEGSPPGTLIYLKPVLRGDEPADVAAYARAHPAFPHEGTQDQFFSESQFESYRRLGAWTCEAAAGALVRALPS
ncbi:MAG: patatin-like phospholipase family protein [Acidobacteria bacterium]|nr:patatin-like phospholipase family protein [Acidobacteriota bacterium]